MKREFLAALMGEICPTGHEWGARKVWRAEADSIADGVRGDFHGNSIAVLNPDSRLRIMLAGHIDEIGLQISHINKEGFLFFRGLGGWDMQVFPGQRVRILTKSGVILGVIGRPAIHLQEKEDREKVTKYDDLWIDIGAKDREDAEKLIRIGDGAVLDYGGPEDLLNGLMVSRGFDDRIGAFIVLEAMRRIKEIGGLETSLFSVATVQEEIGTLGAITSCFGIEPQVGIAVDVGFATDTPGLEKAKKRCNDIKMGGGPLIATGPNINPILFQLIVDTAKVNDIPIQIVAWEKQTGTDARAIQISRSGVATGLISVPNRYMHSPGEIVHVGDVENVIELFARVVLTIDDANQFIL